MTFAALCLDLRHLEAPAFQSRGRTNMLMSVQEALNLFPVLLRYGNVKGRTSRCLFARGVTLLGGPAAFLFGPVDAILPAVTPAQPFAQVNGILQGSLDAGCLGRDRFNSCHLEAGTFDARGRLDGRMSVEEALDRFPALARIGSVKCRATKRKESKKNSTQYNFKMD